MDRLKKIDINDNIVFDSRDEAMEACFSPYTISLMKATAYTYDGCYAWFPKAEITDRYGKIKTGAQSSNWKNHFEDNGNKIISWLYPDEPQTKEGTEPEVRMDSSPVHCFWCENPKQVSYKYVGTYLYDENASVPRHRIYRRIAVDIDLKPWYEENGDFEYYDLNKEGIPSLNKMCINGDFTYTQKLISDFEAYYSKQKSIENELHDVINTTRNLPILKIDKLINGLINSFFDFYEEKIDKSFFYRGNITDGEIGRLIADILLLRDNQHNNILRESFLDKDTGKVLALYDDRYFLYSLSEGETEYFLNKLQIHYNNDDDIVEKQNILYFWKQCNHSMFEWSVIKYYSFLIYAFGNFDSAPVQESYAYVEDSDENISNEDSAYLMTGNPNIWPWDDERERFYRNVVLKLNVEAKRYNGMNRVHLKYNSVGFAVFDMNKHSYNLATRKEIFDSIEIYDYEAEDNLGPNHAIVKGILYEDTEILYKLIAYITQCENASSFLNRKYHISNEEINASEEIEELIQKELDDYISKDNNIIEENGFEYEPKPEDRKIVKETNETSGVSTYPREPQKRVNALMRARFMCEINPNHKSFISKKTDMPYMETHHLIPLEYWRSFDNNLDVEANIICLCSNCHNEIHYGKYAEKLIKPLFMKRKQELQKAGISIGLDDLLKLYNGEEIV